MQSGHPHRAGHPASRVAALATAVAAVAPPSAHLAIMRSLLFCAAVAQTSTTGNGMAEGWDTIAVDLSCARWNGASTDCASIGGRNNAIEVNRGAWMISDRDYAFGWITVPVTRGVVHRLSASLFLPARPWTPMVACPAIRVATSIVYCSPSLTIKSGQAQAEWWAVGSGGDVLVSLRPSSSSITGTDNGEWAVVEGSFVPTTDLITIYMPARLYGDTRFTASSYATDVQLSVNSPPRPPSPPMPPQPPPSPPHPPYSPPPRPPSIPPGPPPDLVLIIIIAAICGGVVTLLVAAVVRLLCCPKAKPEFRPSLKPASPNGGNAQMEMQSQTVIR